MMQAMLADRFHLRLHTEVRQERVFGLNVGKGGFQLQDSGAPVPPATEGRVNAAMGDRGGRMIGEKSTMAGMVIALQIFLGRPVIDQTGLRGYYDFNLRWTAPETNGLQPAGG